MDIKTNRMKALDWFNKKLYIEKFELIVKYKKSIIGYPDRSPDTLTGSEIEMLYQLELLNQNEK